MRCGDLFYVDRSDKEIRLLLHAQLAESVSRTSRNTCVSDRSRNQSTSKEKTSSGRLVCCARQFRSSSRDHTGDMALMVWCLGRTKSKFSERPQRTWYRAQLGGCCVIVDLRLRSLVKYSSGGKGALAEIVLRMRIRFAFFVTKRLAALSPGSSIT